MNTHRFLRLLPAALLPWFCVGCVNVGWPTLPTVTYRGRVVDEANRLVAGAEVIFHRPSFYHSAAGMDDTEQEIAKTHTGKDGTFEVTTSGGYATEVYAGAPHRSGRIGEVTYDPRSHALPKDLEIKMRRY